MAEKKKLMIVVAGGIAFVVVLVLLSLPFAIGRYQLYTENCWTGEKIQAINAHVDDSAWVAKEARSLKWQGKYVSPDMILMENDMWLIYADSCGKEGWEMDAIFIARASNGKWYRTKSHFCENGCENAMTNQPSDSLLTFIKRHDLTEFSGEVKVQFLDKWSR